jgi:hypothetical protein
MLRIRHEQMSEFSESTYLNFENRMLIHLRKFFPERCEALGEENCSELIEYGVRRAAAHGFTSERNVCKYLDLMMCFGPDFDENPELKWPGPILGDETLKNPNYKMQLLFEAGIYELNQKGDGQ